MYLLFTWHGIRTDFEAGNSHFEGHWKGWALEIETFLGPEMATCQKSRDFQGPPLPMARIMDLPA
jgi:hypothetical protein